jgi:hypothetical protein
VPTQVTIHANYTQAESGDVVSSECLEHRPTLSRTLVKVRPPNSHDH